MGIIITLLLTSSTSLLLSPCSYVLGKTWLNRILSLLWASTLAADYCWREKAQSYWLVLFKFMTVNSSGPFMTLSKHIFFFLAHSSFHSPWWLFHTLASLMSPLLFCTSSLLMILFPMSLRKLKQSEENFQICTTAPTHLPVSIDEQSFCAPVYTLSFHLCARVYILFPSQGHLSNDSLFLLLHTNFLLFQILLIKNKYFSQFSGQLWPHFHHCYCPIFGLPLSVELLKRIAYNASHL